MGTTYTSTIEVRCWKEHTCACCGAVYAYEFVRKVSGQGNNEANAAVAARKAAEKAMQREVDLQPCPTCGLYQPDMVGQQRAGRHLAFFWLALIASGVIVVLGATNVMQMNTAVYSAVALCALAALAHVLSESKNLNADVAANQAVAAERVAAGKLMVGRPGQSTVGTQAAEQACPRGSAGQKVVLLMAVLAVGLAAAPEVLRISRGWALNNECYPPVVGPGDDTRIYMNEKIHSIKGYWKGKPSVKISDPAATGAAARQKLDVTVVTNDKTWGNTIYAKSSQKNSSSTPWVRLTLPDDPSLANKALACDVRLDIEYPASTGGKSFEERSGHMERNLTVRTASPGAGTAYAAWWWQGTVAGMGLLAACGLALNRMGRALQRRANPTRLLTLNQPGPAAAGPLVSPGA